MSVEALVIAALVEEGSVKKAFQAGVGAEDFEIYDQEFAWLVRQMEKRKTISERRFLAAFPDFEFVQSGERVQDLLEDFKQERAFVSISSGIDEVLQELDHENAVEQAVRLREILGDAIRGSSAASDVLIKSDWRQHYKEQKELQILRESGHVAGIPTGIRHLDHHWGGLQPATTYCYLGRPGDAKSFNLAKLAVEGHWEGRRVGLFSPEMTERQHRCRIATLLSGKKEVQEELDLKGAFRNRALRDGHGYNLKEYRRFLEWYEETVEGEICLFTQKFRREKMSLAFIENRIEDLGIELVIIDPIYKLKFPRKRQLKHEELADIVDGIQDLAHAFNIPVVMSNQAGRALVGSRGDPPTKDSSHGSDAPSQEADVVIGVKHHSEERMMKLNCSKNRHGESFKFTMKCNLNIGLMEDVTPIKGDYFNGYDPEMAEELREAMSETEKKEKVEANG